MSLLKTKTHHDCSSIRLQRYLESKNGSERLLALDWNGNVRNPEFWGKEFDEWREYWGKNEGRTLRHFIISPDPEAHATLEQLRDLAYFWATEHFGDDGQWVIAYHDDNGILHAHVALNCVRMDGYKWQFPNYAGLANDLHRLTREMGLKCDLRDVGRKQDEDTKRWEKRTGGEIRIHARSGWSWKEDIRIAIRQCAPKSRSFEEFKRNLYRYYGVKVNERRRGGLTFVHPMHNNDSNHRYTCKDCKLGFGFVSDSINGMLAYDVADFLNGGELEGHSFALGLDRTTKELKFVRKAIRPLPKEKTYCDRLIRKCRRVGLAYIPKNAEALRCFRKEADAAASEGRSQNINKAYQHLCERQLALEQELAKIDTKLKLAFEVKQNIRAYNATLSIANELSQKNRFARKRFAEENAEAIRKHETAVSWLRGAGFDIDGQKICEDEYFSEWLKLDKQSEQVKTDLQDIKQRTKKLYESIKLISRQTRPVRLRGDKTEIDENAIQTKALLGGYTTRIASRDRRITSSLSTTNTRKRKQVAVNQQSAEMLKEGVQRTISAAEAAMHSRENAITRRIIAEDRAMVAAEAIGETYTPNIPSEIVNQVNYGNDPSKWSALKREEMQKKQRLMEKYGKEQEHTVANIAKAAKARAAETQTDQKQTIVHRSQSSR